MTAEQKKTIVAKINGSMPTVLKGAAVVIGIVISATTVWATLNIQVEQNTRALNAYQAEHISMGSRLRRLEDSIIRQEVQYKFIEDTLTEMKADIKDMKR